MIHYFTPWNSDKNIGAAYNDAMRLLHPTDWACFVDGDAVFTTHDFGRHIEAIVAEYGQEYDLFTSVTNRNGYMYTSRFQLFEHVPENNDMAQHRVTGEHAWHKHGNNIRDITHGEPISGVLILLSRKAWMEVGGFKEDGMLGIDNDIHYRIRDYGMKAALMKGVYLYHWYRGGNVSDKAHLL